MNRNKVILPFTSLLILLLFSNTSFSQDSILIPRPKYDKAKFRELFTQANLMTAENFNDTALNTLLLLHTWDPSNANVNFKIGQLYLTSTSEKPQAVKYLEAAAPLATKKYIPDEPTERRCPELVYYLLGQAYHLTYRFDEAIAMFELFFKSINSSNHTAANDLMRRIEIAKTAKMFVSSPVKCIITNLGDSINTDKPEYGAVITADESAMYFTSRRYNPETGGNDNKDIFDNYYEDIWVSYKKEDNTWTEAKPLSTRINSWYNEAVSAISADGQQLLLYKNDKGGNIYYSKLEGDQWSYTYMLGTDEGDITDINTPAWEPSASFSADGRTLYFVSDRAGGYGGRDIYKCIKLPTGKWSKATNLGPVINTKYDEDAPFMHPDGFTMFFSSNGHNTMGGFDVFFSVLGDSGWIAPQNAGYPINTTDDDIFYVMSTDGKRAYLSSVRPEGKGEKDIYLVTIPQRVVIPVTLLKGYISFAGVKDTMITFVTITATDKETGDIIQEVHPNTRTMKYILPLNPGRSGKTYLVKYEADGYRPHTELISVSPAGEYQEIDKNFDFKNLGSISIYGKITRRSGEPVSAANISVNDKNNKLVSMTKVMADGTYSLELPGRGGENYFLTYEAPDYIPMKASVSIPQPLTEYDFNRDIIMEKASMIGTISVSGTVTDKNKSPIKDSKISITDNKTGLTIGSYTPNEKGYYYFNLPRGTDYNVTYEADGYLFQSENINEGKEKTYSELVKNVVLENIAKNAKVVLNNIFFDSGKATLRKSSNVELDKLHKLITAYINIKIEVSGYTDDKGDENKNLTLSQMRADAVVNYLISKGIDRSRVIAKGYGETQPIAPNSINGKPNAKGMQMNRRVEFKILEVK